MTRQKYVNGIQRDLTPEEEARLDARADADDQDVSSIRHRRNNFLNHTDRTQMADWPLGDHTIEEWQTYRQELRDYMASQTRVSTQTAWPKSPVITAAGQAAYDTEVAKDGSGPAAGETARAAAEQAAGYPGPGV